MNQKYKKLKRLLMELFQLDQPDLDFGLYRGYCQVNRFGA